MKIECTICNKETHLCVCAKDREKRLQTLEKKIEVIMENAMTSMPTHSYKTLKEIYDEKENI